MGDPLLRLPQARGPCADEVQAALALATDQSGALQHAKMPGDGRLGDVKGLGQRRYPGLSALGKALHDAAARGIGQGCKNCGNLFPFVNHRVNYTDRSRRVKDYLTHALTIAESGTKGAGAEQRWLQSLLHWKVPARIHATLMPELWRSLLSRPCES